MRGWRAFSVRVAWVVWAVPATSAERPIPSDLPPTELARLWIDHDAGVVEARRSLDAAMHGAAALRASPYEWIGRATAQRRRYDSGGNSNEWSAALERTIRIGGKAEIDRQLGDTELAIAQAAIGEARREAARALMELWLNVSAATRQHGLLTEQLGFAEANHKAVETRRRAGDASQLDVNVARADLLDMQRQIIAAKTSETKAKAKLATRFPRAEYEPRALAEPPELEMPQAEWRERILARSDSIRIARELFKKAELTAARAKAERIPDPTVGVYTASEAFRNERIVGLSFSIPLSGTYRSERMQQALREAEAALARVERQLRDKEIEIVEAYVEATGGRERWRLASQGALTTRESARLTQRAYALGEADLQTLLLARRQALDAANAAETARVDALRWHYQLMVDAHVIWGLVSD